MTHEEREEIQRELGGVMLADDIALFKMRLEQLNQGMDEDTERLANSIADIIGRLHGVHVTKEELGL
jgi:hypothetical protein